MIFNVYIAFTQGSSKKGKEAKNPFEIKDKMIWDDEIIKNKAISPSIQIKHYQSISGKSQSDSVPRIVVFER